MMIWKVDWNSLDNFARSGISDIDRIVTNYIALKNDLNVVFGTSILFIDLVDNGYKTIPFDYFINALEDNIHKTKVFGVNWIGTKKTFIAYGTAPNFEDINRWEENGKTLENVINISKKNFLRCGSFSAGNIRIAQKIRRG